MNKNCLIVAAGDKSLHRQYIDGPCDFDMHLLVYDNSAEKWRGDTPYICKLHGYKLKMTYAYLTRNPEILERYDYFLLADDDISMTSADVNAIFSAMRRYGLQIGQPSLVDSYYSWYHTLHDEFCLLRYTNFVEVMIPCFSREALRKVLFTFNENDCGWGTESHWPLLIDSNRRDIAIIDEVKVVHTRPVQSGTPQNFRDLDAYLKKYNLKAEAYLYGEVENPQAGKSLFSHKVYIELKWGLVNWISRKDGRYVGAPGLDGMFGYILFASTLACITQARKYADLAMNLMDSSRHLGSIKDDLTLAHGITGCCYAVELMTAQGTIEADETDCLLYETDRHIENRFSENGDELTTEELVGVGLYFLKKYDRTQSDRHLAIAREAACCLKGRDVALSSGDDLMMACGAAELFNRFAIPDSKLPDEIRGLIAKGTVGNIERLIALWRLYLVTGDEAVYGAALQLADNATFDIGNVTDALRLALLMMIRIGKISDLKT